MTLPTLAHTLENIPGQQKVVLHVDGLSIIDHTCLELIEDFHEGGAGKAPHDVELDLGRLHETYREPAFEKAAVA